MEWKKRYQLEDELLIIYAAEELYWQKRGGEKWLLKGDSNTSYFHKCANGRKRKSMITSLEDGDNILTDQEELRAHIIDFYKKNSSVMRKQPIYTLEMSFGVSRRK